jgi:c-di-GMP-binding flagellar brake protein YcgR
MGDKMVIKLGEKVQVKVGKDWYITTIECLGGASVFFVSPPMSKQMRITLQEEQDYIISVVNKKGLYEFDVRVLESDVRDQNANVPLTKLLITSEPRHQQRRSAYRAEVIVDVRIREPAEPENPDGQPAEYRPKTLNLSESGMLFLSKKSYAPGVMLSCDILLNKYGLNLTLEDIQAKVIRTRRPELTVPCTRSALIL